MNHVTKMYLNTHQVARTLLSFSFHCHVWRIRDFSVRELIYNAYVMCVCTLISQGNQAAATTKIPITLLKSTVKLCILNCTKQGRAEQRCPLPAARCSLHNEVRRSFRSSLRITSFVEFHFSLRFHFASTAARLTLLPEFRGSINFWAEKERCQRSFCCQQNVARTGRRAEESVRERESGEGDGVRNVNITEHARKKREAREQEKRGRDAKRQRKKRPLTAKHR